MPPWLTGLETQMPNFSISIANQQRTLRFDRRRLIRLARSVLLQEQVAAAEISVAVLDDSAIHAINRQFLNHDYPTDVISFLLECSLVDGTARGAAAKAAVQAETKNVAVRKKTRPSGGSPTLVRRGAAKMIEGEIVISAETAAGNAARFGNSPQDELALYLVHGLLHLCGYDDLTPKEKRLMRRREAEALQALDIVPPRRRIVSPRPAGDC